MDFKGVRQQTGSSIVQRMSFFQDKLDNVGREKKSFAVVNSTWTFLKNKLLIFFIMNKELYKECQGNKFLCMMW